MTHDPAQDDLIQSVADALQYHLLLPPGRTTSSALGDAYEREESPAAKDAIAQILTNSRMCAEGHRPICQDTGIVVVFVKVGMDVQWDGVTMASTRHGQRRRAPRLPRPRQQAARLDRRRPAVRAQEHASDNTPAVIHVRARARRHGRSAGRRQGRRLGEQVQVRDAESVGLDRRLGAEDGADDGRRLVPAGHARHRHRRHRREGDAARQGSADGADRHARAQGSAVRANKREELRIELYDKVNALGIGAQGLGGLSTVLDVKILDLPDARGEPAGRDDPELRGDAPRAFRARRLAAPPSSSRRISPAGPTVALGARRRERDSVDLDTLTPRRSRDAGSRANRCCCRQAC